MCLKRKVTCTCCNDYESTFEDVTTNHTPICPSGVVQRKNVENHLNSTCPLEVVNCSFSYAGCEERLPRKDMPAHINESLAVHMSLQAVSHQQQLEKLESRVQTLETRNLKLVALNRKVVGQSKVFENRIAKYQSFVRAHLRILPVTIVMNKFSEKKMIRREWDSEPFYTHSCGYKMNLQIHANGAGSGENTHVSVYAVFRCGEFDNQLMWPFRGSIIVQLLNQKAGVAEHTEHHGTLITFRYADVQNSCRVTHDGCGSGLGITTFISHKELFPKYLKDDSLSFRVFYRPY